ncbi:interferon-beta production [Mactra antiquata]
MVAWSSNLFHDADSSSSDDTTKSLVSKEFMEVNDWLKCFVCDDYFIKPRILPCGHSYCEKCVLSLREKASHEFNLIRDRNAHRRGECGNFACPRPYCGYTMKIMNVSRWSVKNKALGKAADAARRHEQDKQTIASQTDIDGGSVIVPLPKTLTKTFTLSNNDRRSPTSTIVQSVLQNLVAMDTVDIKHCKPPDDNNSITGAPIWKNVGFMFAMAAFDHVIKMA